MSYDKVAKDLARSIQWRVIAHDDLPEHGGCILYLDAPIKRINIEIAALDRGAEELAEFIRDRAKAMDGSAKSLEVGVRDGVLAVL